MMGVVKYKSHELVKKNSIVYQERVVLVGNDWHFISHRILV